MEKETNDQSGESTVNVFDLLGGAMQGAQSTMSSVSMALKNSFERSTQMNEMMNMIFHQMIQTNVKLYTRIESSSDGCFLYITIHNTTMFPFVGMTGMIDFEPVSRDQEDVDSISELPKLTLISSLHYPPNEQLAQPVDPLFLPSDDATSTSKNINTTVLHPNTKHVEVLRLNTSFLKQYNGVARIQISSPGDGTSDSVHVTQSFGVYLIDQMKKIANADTNVQSTLEEDEPLEREYNGKFIRNIFDLAPGLGLKKGMRIYLEPLSGEDESIICQINAVCMDTGKFQVRFSGKNKNLVDLLVHELDFLDE